MDPRDVLTRPAPPPDHVLHYGPAPDQVADLRLPPGLGEGAGADAAAAAAAAAARRGPVLVLLLHGGFWRAAYDRTHLGPLAAALAAENFVVCTPEFRRTGQPGGGWPGTFDDIAAAVDRLPGMVRSVLGGAGVRGAGVRGAGVRGEVVLAGHSAGGHLALWSAGRHRLGPDSPWYRAPGGADGVPDPKLADVVRAARVSGAKVASVVGDAGVMEEVAGVIEVAGVVALAPVSDLAACYRAGLDHDAAGELLGGSPEEQPERYAATDPARLVPLGVPVHIVHGTADDRVPFAMSRSFAELDRAAGDPVALDVLAGGGHFDVIDPLSAAWPVVMAAFRAAADHG